MAGEVGDLEAIKHRELDGLVGPRRQDARRLVELLDLVYGHQVRTAQLGEATSECEPRADPPDETGVGERPADVRDRRLREPQPPSEFARPDRFTGCLRKDVEDEGGSGDRGRERVRPARGRFVHQRVASDHHLSEPWAGPRGRGQ